jgi:hypothetical protein
MIHMMYPNAVILHTMRDPMDTLLSCYRYLSRALCRIHPPIKSTRAPLHRLSSALVRMPPPAFVLLSPVAATPHLRCSHKFDDTGATFTTHIDRLTLEYAIYLEIMQHYRRCASPSPSPSPSPPPTQMARTSLSHPCT